MKRLVMLLAVVLAQGCASLTPSFETPEAKLVSFAPAGSKGLEQRFKLEVRILNPNAVALDIDGLSYALTLNGHKVASGVASQIPEVPAYGEAVVALYASTSILGGAKFILDLLQERPADLEYVLETKLDLGLLQPSIRLTEQGTVGLGD